MQPDFQTYGELGFAVEDQRSTQLLAVAVEGRFDSYFKDKPSPLVVPPKEDNEENEAVDDKGEPHQDKEQGNKSGSAFIRVIDRSPASARIIVFASSTFLTDTMLDLAAVGMGTRYVKPVQLVENAIDWAMEDRGLLTLRGRAHFSRSLKPLNRESQVFWEYLNYGLALCGLLLIGLNRRQANKRAALRYAVILGTAEKRGG